MSLILLIQSQNKSVLLKRASHEIVWTFYFSTGLMTVYTETQYI